MVENTVKRKTRIFISQPMNGRSEEDIDRERSKIIDILPYILKDDNPFLVIPKMSELVAESNHPAYCLGQSIKDMSVADVVVFAPKWNNARGCVIEHKVCEAYDIEYIELINAAGMGLMPIVDKKP